ncbi:bifunctional diguanylate cyclase/phosphodiesterase [Fulvimonas soli]|uniref:bifunctional diguanylate cyclase/phosphodiesterase n=1 Tax=Fulvimonas soli TaxID=155197 RepID=UPI001FEBC1E0|nr:EAL domain-containing protein [Fulvimonas soli]
MRAVSESRRQAITPGERASAFAAGDELALPHPGRWPTWLWGVLVLAGALAVALALYQRQRVEQAERYQAELTVVVDRSQTQLLRQLQSTELLVRSVQTVFLASDDVTPVEFERLYENLHARELFPSLLALAYAPREARPDGEHYVTRMAAPREGNAQLLGLDLAAQPGNLAAALSARDTDRGTLSGPMHLIQDVARRHPGMGVVMRLPIYSPGDPPRTVEQRRARVIGTIGLSFLVDDLVRTALPADAAARMHVQLADVTGGQPQPLFDSAPGRPIPALVAERGLSFERRLPYGGREWLLVMAPFDAGLPPPPWQQSVLLPGAIISVLLGVLAWLLGDTRRRALQAGWRMSQRYRESEERFRALNEMLPALVLLADADEGRVVYANQAARARLGGAVGRMRLADVFVDPEQQLKLAHAETPAVDGVEALLRAGADAQFWANVSLAPMQLDGRRQLVMVAADISRLRELTEQLGYQASHDSLTDLYNRPEFERRLERALGEVGAASACALLYIDLDQFKLINDTSGHAAGDQLLAQLAVLLRQHLRAGDVLARLGGDEFGLLLAGIGDREGAARMAELLRQRIDGYVFVWGKRSYTITASIGVVMIDRPGLARDELFAQADAACYLAKEQGRNRVHLYSEQDDRTLRRRSEMEWVNRLRWAVDERRLVLAYQELRPLVPEPGRGPRIELLLRFRDDDGRLVLPGTFLPAAENYGLMPTIDRWVIETALANFDCLHPAGAALEVATINLSGASVEDDALAGRIVELLAQHGVAPGRVCFEITETVAVRHLSKVARFMGRLRAAGCKVALDDFGAGMSSFSYLKNLPVDLIKIDGSFIRDMLTDQVSHAMVRAVCDIGHRLGLQVAAEWVNGEDIVAELTALGIDLAQGFGLHYPELVPFHRR